MYELHPAQFLSAQSLFRPTRYGVLAAGTLEGGHPGRVFVDDLDHPCAGLIATRVGYYFLAGQPEAGFLDDLYAFFTGELVPRQKADTGSPEVVLFFDPEDWHASLFTRFAALRPVRIRKLRHTLRAELTTSSPWQANIPGNLRLAPFSAELLATQPDLAGEAALFFGFSERFLEKSLGFCLQDGEAIACTCSAIFVGGGEAELSIQTAEAYRRQGLGWLTASACIDACLMHGLRPVWGCWPENEPSVRLAHKLGFVLDYEQPACLWVDEEGWSRG